MSTVVKPDAFRHTAPTAGDTVAEKLADFAAGFDLSHAPAEIVELAKLHVLDCFGIGLASTTMDYGQRAVAAGRAMGGAGDSPVIGTGVRLPLRPARLVRQQSFDHRPLEVPQVVTAPIIQLPQFGS